MNHSRWVNKGTRRGLAWGLCLALIQLGCQPRAGQQLAQASPAVAAPTFDCEAFEAAVQAMQMAQQASPYLPTSQYDYSSYPYDVLEPGQARLSEDSLHLRLIEDLDYEPFLLPGHRLLLHIEYLQPSGEPADLAPDTLRLDRARYARWRRPYMAYRFPLNGKQLAGKQLRLSFQPQRQTPEGSWEPLCEARAIASRQVKPRCCTAQAWEQLTFKWATRPGPLGIPPSTYHYAGFTGLLDITFDNNSSVIANAEAMLQRVQRQIDRFDSLDYQVESVDITGYASIQGNAAQNRRLSEQRARELYRGLQAHNPALRITHQGAGEDWALTRRLMRAQPLDAAQARRVQQVLDAELDADEREARLRALELGDAFWEAVLPPARHTLALLTFTYTGSENLLQAFPDSLPLESRALEQAALWQVQLAEPGPEGPEGGSERQLEALDALLAEQARPTFWALKAAYLKSTEPEAAVEALRQAEQLGEPRWRPLRWHLQLEHARADEAYALLSLTRELEEVNEPSRLMRSLLARAYARQGRTPHALDVLDGMEKQAPLDAAARNDRGIVHVLSHQWKQAEQDFRAALQGNDPLPEAAYNLALLAAHRGLLDEALVYVQQVAQAQPGWEQALLQQPVFQYMRQNARFEPFE